jgi:antitoxin component YwqK of YwqJK toxin-antitoxin module
MSKLQVLFISILLISCVAKDEKVIELWSNNQVKIKKVYYHENDTGQYVILTYYTNGQIESRTPFISKNKNGWGTTFYENGKVKDSIFYRDNIPTTTAYHFYANGGQAYVGQFNELGKRYGWWTFFDSLGRIKEKTEYIHHDLKTTTYYFDTLGWMIREVIFNEANDEKVLIERNYKDSVLHGVFKKYYETGVLAKAGEYANGQLKNMQWTDFYKNGQKFMEYTFADRDNLIVINLWNEDGTLTVKEGNGKHITFEYCQNGKVKAKIETRYKGGYLVRRNKVSFKNCLL